MYIYMFCKISIYLSICFVKGEGRKTLGKGTVWGEIRQNTERPFCHPSEVSMRTRTRSMVQLWPNQDS